MSEGEGEATGTLKRQMLLFTESRMTHKMLAHITDDNKPTTLMIELMKDGVICERFQAVQTACNEEKNACISIATFASISEIFQKEGTFCTTR